MVFIRRLVFVISFCCATNVWGQLNPNQPHIGYLYPSGGQQGTIIQVTAGGQFLRGATKVYISGEGVHAKVIKHIRPFRNLNAEQQQLLRQTLRQIRDKKLAELNINIPAPLKREINKKDANDPNTVETKLPDHPLLYDLENKSLRELAHITNILFFPRRMLQINRQILESVLIEIAIDPNAEPGNRELRIETPAGLTNPMVFQVGLLPEIRELEPNNRQAYQAYNNLLRLPQQINLPEEKPMDLPVILNGQIRPGDIDRFRFRAKKGQKLVIETNARNLIPYLADAVPGWFQATLALYDAMGKEVAYADDYRFNPDPVLFYQIQKDGEYELEIRDSLYRGREDFIYRIAVSEQPFITQIFPLGAKTGTETITSIRGWNLTATKLLLNTQSKEKGIYKMAYQNGKILSNPVVYAVDNLPECNETEYNNTTDNAQQIVMPKIINGRIDSSSDVDVFWFKGQTGDKVVVEIYGRRLNSPLDSILKMTDDSNNVLAWNDDYVIEDNHLYKDITGLLTHHADSYIIAELPKDGTYFVHLADSQNHGGRDYGYRLRISAPEPDFAVRVTPSSLSIRPGGTVSVYLHVLRKDGFDGEIEIILKDAPPGFKINGGHIPAGRDTIRMTITAPPASSGQSVALQLQGRASINGKTVSHNVIPAEDMMQAFLYRHLVPSQELLASIQNVKRSVPTLELADSEPVRIPINGSAQVRIKTAKRRLPQDIQLQLNEPPDGVTLHDVTVKPAEMTFVLKADSNEAVPGFTDNLIVEAFRETVTNSQGDKINTKKRRISLGVLPAIPIEIVQKQSLSSL